MALLQEEQPQQQEINEAERRPGGGPAAGENDEAVLIREMADLVAEEGHRFGKREVLVSATRVSSWTRPVSNCSRSR
jgi:hypothetical protein